MTDGCKARSFFSIDIAQNERENIRQRQAQGIVTAKANGQIFGRPHTEVPADFPCIVESWTSGRIKVTEAADQCEMSIATFYRRLRDYRLEKGLSR